MEYKSWNQYVEMVAYDEEGNTKSATALYIVAVPNNEKLEKNVEFNCYRPTYMPQELVEKLGKAYGVSTEFDIEDTEKYNIKGYRPDMDIYVFNENLSFKEGLDQVYKLLEDVIKKEGFKPARIEVII